MEATAIQQDKIFMAGKSDVGKVRKNNEDAFHFSVKNDFFFLCDGMGGHESGEVASKLAVETMQQVLRQPDSFNITGICEDVQQRLPKSALNLIAGVRLANRRILLHAMNNPHTRGMGTTIVSAFYEKGLLYTAHVGDSRIYRLRNGKLKLLTNDHSWLNELIEDNEITESEIKDFNEKNVLTRALGTYPTVKVDLRIEHIEEGDLFLLCSDGLHNGLKDREIEKILNSSSHNSLQEAVDAIVKRAKDVDGSDNITAGLIYIPNLNQKAKPVKFSRTIPDESDEISSLLDKTIKNYYQLSIGKALNLKKWGAIAGILAVLAATAFYFNMNDQSANTMNAGVSSALFTQDIESDLNEEDYMSSKVMEDAGVLILLQVSDEKYIDVFRNMKRVHLLDAPTSFKNNIPIHSGVFTWAIADSSGYILYKNNNLKLEPIQTEENKAKTNSAQRTGSVSTPSITDTSVPSNRGLLYIIGSFQGNTFENSEIFINDRKIGKLHDFLDDGFYVRPGIYSVTIRAESGRVQRIKRNVDVTGGQIIAVEF